MKQLDDKYQRREQGLSLRDRLNSINFRKIGKKIISCIPIVAMAGLLYNYSSKDVSKNVYDSIQIQAGRIHTGIVRDFDDYATTISYENEAARKISNMIDESYPAIIVRGFRFIYNEGDTTDVTRFTDKLTHELTTVGHEQVQDTTKEGVLDIMFTKQELKKQH